MSFLSKIFHKTGPARQAPVAAYAGAREIFFQSSPEDLTLSQRGEVRGVLMDTANPDGAFYTLMATADGSVSLYVSTGGGCMGCGQHPGPKQVAQVWLAAAKDFIAHCQPAKTHPLPQPGHVRFYFLRGRQILTLEAKRTDLEQRLHPFWPLFFQGIAVIGEIRQIDATRRSAAEAAQGGGNPPASDRSPPVKT